MKMAQRHGGSGMAMAGGENNHRRQWRGSESGDENGGMA